MIGAPVESAAAPEIAAGSAAAEMGRAPAPRHAFAAPSWLRRPFVSCLLLLAVYAGLSMFNDPRGTLGTDTGGKLATLHVMEERGTLVPDLGYWAAREDPSGRLHPLFYTYDIGGHWVNVTTLPMLEVAYPLYLVGGQHAILLLPMLGAMLCALAARALARRLDGGGGWTAFWVIGLATPVAIYALDFWEHSLGLGFMLWGAVMLLDVAEQRAGWRGALAGGALFGVAATMRTEALVYIAVGAAVACLTLLVHRRALQPAIGRGVAIVAGAGAVLLANQLLERAVVGASIRAGRAAGTAGAAGGSATERAKEALATSFGLNLFASTTDWCVGLVVVALVVYGAWALRDRSVDRTPTGVAALAVVAVFMLLRFTTGLGFVPGLLTASPFAAVGFALGWRARERRLPLVLACAALPLVWFFQFSGGAGPQWGGRYQLLSGALLAIVGVVVLRGYPRALVGVLVVAVVVTAGGLVWLSVRSHTVVAAMEMITARHDEAVISRDAHALREGGAFYEPSRHWLTATTERDFRKAVRIVAGAGDREFALITTNAADVPASVGGFTRGRTQHVALLPPDVKVLVVSYRRA